MINVIDLGIMKRKFGTLLSKMYCDARMSIEVITDSLLRWDMPDLLERNNSEEFLNNSTETLAKQLGCHDFVFSEDINSALFWSGIQYMNIFFNTRIPMKQIFLLMPLDQMINRFEIFHEMNETEIVKEFISVYEKNSILRALRKRKDMNLSTLSFLTGISVNTLKHYEKENTNLFKASFANIEKLKNSLKCSDSFFYEQSSFIPYSESFWKDDICVKNFKKTLSSFLNIAQDDFAIVLEEFEKPSGSSFLHIGTICFLKNKKSKKQIKSSIIERAISLAIDAVLTEHTSANLYF